MTEPNLFEPVLDHYGGEAPSVGVDTSREAAASVDRPSAQRLVLDAVSRSMGLVCGEVEEFTGLTHQSASARLRELSQDPDSPIWKVTNKRRYAKTGRYQHVYYTAERAQALGLERAPLHPERPTPEAAADEIERLRAENGELRAEYAMKHNLTPEDIGMVRVDPRRYSDHTQGPHWRFPDE